jgi:hypothetical protein
MVCYTCNSVIASGQQVHRRQVQTSSRAYYGRRGVSTGVGYSVKPFCSSCVSEYDRQLALANAAGTRAFLVVVGAIVAVLLVVFALTHK